VAGRRRAVARSHIGREQELVVGPGAAGLFRGASLFLGTEPSLHRGAGRASSDAFLLGSESLSDEPGESLPDIGPVPKLGPKSRARQPQHAGRIDSAAESGPNSVALARSKHPGGSYVPRNVNPCCRFVGMLPAGPGRRRERELELIVGDLKRPIDANAHDVSCALNASVSVTGSSQVPLWQT
jgi:hypothetical protein